MNNVGLKSPDYWVHTGDNQSGNYICKNTFSVAVNPDNTCYDNSNSQSPTSVKTFSKIKME